MKRTVYVFIVTLLMMGMRPGEIQASVIGAEGHFLQIATTDTRPLYIDKLLYAAFRDISYQAAFTSLTMQIGYDMANNGEKDGVISALSTLETNYPHLIKVPTALDSTGVYVFVPAGSPREFNSWDELEGLRVGVLANRYSLLSHLPENAEVIEKESTRLIFDGLVAGEYDAAVLFERAHETITEREDVVRAGLLASLVDYLYLHERHAALVPVISDALQRLMTDGRGDAILNGRLGSDFSPYRTILHILTTSTEAPGEDTFTVELRDRMRDETDLEWYSLSFNAKRFPMDAARRESFAQLLRQDCVTRNVAAIVVSGEEALAFVKDYYYLFFCHTPVLFYNIGYEDEAALQDYTPYFTGLTEYVSARETLEAALSLFPQTKTVYVLNDYTEEGRTYRAEMERQLAPLSQTLTIQYNNDIDMTSLTATLKNLPLDSIVLAGAYIRDAYGQYYTQNVMRNIMETNCEAPVFSVYTTDLGYNAIGGKCEDYHTYGEIAANTLQNLLSGASPSTIPVVDMAPYARWVFNQNELDRFGINPSRLPEGAVILNAVPSIWESDPRFASAVVALLILGITAIAVVFLIMYQYSRQREHLKTTRALLQKEITLSEARDSLQTILDATYAPICIVDYETKRMVYGNETYLRMLEYGTPEALYQLKVYDTLSPVQPGGVDAVTLCDRIMYTPNPQSLEMQVKTATGRFVAIRNLTSQIVYRGRRSVIGILSDLSAEKEYERMLYATAEKEKEANQLKSRFLVHMSHEIRTPMNVIIGLTELELRKDLPPAIKEVHKKVNQSAKNLLSIVNEVLDLSKIEADKVELNIEEFELEEVIGSALLVAAPRLEGKQVEFLLQAALDLPRFIQGDRTRLWQILKNFLDNAAKYTEQGRIMLTVRLDTPLSDKETAYIHFMIQDTGIGIDEEQMHRLFQPYEQIYSEAQKRYSGTGLGLVIAKQLCELMGGRLHMESTPGSGTTVHIGIPFQRAASAETERQAIQSPSLAGFNILAVDDDDLALSALSELIAGSGAACEGVTSGEEALRVLRERNAEGIPFDLILLDYSMNGLNGLETADKIHTSFSRAPKLLMVTAYQRLRLKQDIYKNHIDDVIEKPFIPTLFIRKLREMLGYYDDAAGTADESFTRFEQVTVLLCEDYILNFEVAAGMFAHFGIETTVAENGIECLRILESGKSFDLIIMDLHMPVMDGFETTRRVRADRRFDAIPIISLTADAMKDVWDQCREAGMADHIAKPMQFNDLQRVFTQWLPEHKRITNHTAGFKYDPLNEGLSRFGGQKELYEKALISFSKHLPDLWPDYNTALLRLEETKDFMHKIKGAAGNLAERELYRSAAAFESSLRNHLPDRDLYERVITASNGYKAKVAEIYRNESAKNNETGTPEAFIEGLNRLRDALIDYDLNKCMAALEVLQHKNWPNANADDLRTLYEYTQSYEYEAALEVLARLCVNEEPIHE